MSIGSSSSIHRWGILVLNMPISFLSAQDEPTSYKNKKKADTSALPFLIL